MTDRRLVRAAFHEAGHAAAIVAMGGRVTGVNIVRSGRRFGECRYKAPPHLTAAGKPIPARVESKSKANHCAHYQPKMVRDLKRQRPQSPQDARAAFDALFKK